MKMGVVTLKTVWSILASLVSTLLFVLLVTIWCCKVWVVSVSGSSKESFDETNKHHPVLMVNSYSQELFWVHRFFFLPTFELQNPECILSGRACPMLVFLVLLHRVGRANQVIW